MRMMAPLEIGFCCRNLDRLVRFYVDVLGCTLVNCVEVSPEKARAARLSAEGYRVARLETPWGERVKLLEPDREPADPGEGPWILDRRNAAYVTFIIDDLQAMLARLAAAGVEIMTGPERVEVRPGTYLAFVRDPEGNVLEFVEYADIGAYRPDLNGRRP